MKFINKNNNNNINLKIFYIILICFAVEKCIAHTFKDTSPNIETKFSSQDAYPPKASSISAESPFESPSESPSESPFESPKRQTEPESEHDTFGHSSSFSAAFSDILKGSLRGHSLTMPPPHSHSEAKQSSLSIEQICAHTDYPDVCLATIQPLITHNFEMINVLEAAIKACSLQVKLTITKVDKHAANNPEIANAVAECRDQYNNALENLQRAIDAISSRDLGTITVMLSAVMADVSTCESAFEDLKASPSSTMSSNDGLVSITVSNSLSIANLIPY
ncbi:uncharacterized protein [Cicer arietinum]|uniref:Probable pectinesterase/pectinesterase inhibitor 23 n=1 Tax=Cicer arietinum TaxID=3827 RepID=A0A1S2XG12_CICAR|nr:probable pectinesterase/pectinesterase inhibitor 23 [Cicer arietinum]